MQFLGVASKTLPLTISSLALIILDLHISHWVSKGARVIEDLMVGPTLKTFRALQLEYGIEERDHYRYLQILHFLHSNPQTSTLLPWRVVLYLTNPFTNIKGISLFYNTLNNKNDFTKSTPIKAWERDIDTAYTTDQWQKTLHITCAATKCVNLWELTHKILLRWYETPYRISKFDPHTSSLCWRNCGCTGTLHHIVWTCPALHTF